MTAKGGPAGDFSPAAGGAYFSNSLNAWAPDVVRR